MTKVEAYLEEVAEREKMATKGPWLQCAVNLVAVGRRDGITKELRAHNYPDMNSSCDLDFVACSRDDIPRLLRIIKRLQDAVELLKSHHPDAACCAGAEAPCGHDLVMKKVADASEYSGEV